MAPINQAHSKAILDVTVAKPLLYIKEAFYGSIVQYWLVLQYSETIPIALSMQLALFGREAVTSVLVTHCTYRYYYILILEYKCRANGRNSRIELFCSLVDDQT